MDNANPGYWRAFRSSQSPRGKTGQFHFLLRAVTAGRRPGGHLALIPQVTSQLWLLHPAAGWLQFALGSLLQFSMSQSYPPLQKRWEI